MGEQKIAALIGMSKFRSTFCLGEYEADISLTHQWTVGRQPCLTGVVGEGECWWHSLSHHSKMKINYWKPEWQPSEKPLGPTAHTPRVGWNDQWQSNQVIEGLDVTILLVSISRGLTVWPTTTTSQFKLKSKGELVYKHTASPCAPMFKWEGPHKRPQC